MNNLDIYFSPRTMDIVVTRDNKEIARIPLGVAFWLKSKLTGIQYLSVQHEEPTDEKE